MEPGCQATHSYPRSAFIPYIQDSQTGEADMLVQMGVDFPKCPRCGSTMEREYQRFCDRCGQRLSWRDFDDAEVIYVGWDGPAPDNLP